MFREGEREDRRKSPLWVQQRIHQRFMEQAGAGL